MKRIGASLGALAALACVLLAVALAAPRVFGAHTVCRAQREHGADLPRGLTCLRPERRCVGASRGRSRHVHAGGAGGSGHPPGDRGGCGVCEPAHPRRRERRAGRLSRSVRQRNWQPGLLCPAGRLRGVVGLPASGAVRGCGGDRLPFRLGLGLIEALWTKSAECARRGIKCKI